MKSAIDGLMVAVSISIALLLNAQPATAEQSLPALSSEQIVQIVGSPDRTAADRTNDVRRKPEQMLAFIGIRPGSVALDVSAGGGYTTELLARAIGPGGQVYGQSQPRDASRPAPAPLAAASCSSRPATVGWANSTRSGISTSSCSRRRASRRTANRLSPPSAK